MKPVHRPYQTEDDFWRMREFLRQVFLLNHQLDYARWHTCQNCAHVDLKDVAHLWEAGGQLAAILMPDGGPGEAHGCTSRG